jgi:hypothetical protein
VPVLRPLRTLVCLIPGLLLAASACSGDELPDEASPAVTRDGLAAMFAGDHPGDDDTETSRCFAEELTARISAAQLRDAGVVDAEGYVVAELPPLPEHVAASWVDAQFACVDFVAVSTDAQERLTKGKLDREAYAECLRGELSEAEMRAGVAAPMTGHWEAPEVAALADAQQQCARAATPRDVG